MMNTKLFTSAGGWGWDRVGEEAHRYRFKGNGNVQVLRLGN